MTDPTAKDLDVNISYCRGRQQRLLEVMREKNLELAIVARHEHVQWLVGPRFYWTFEEMIRRTRAYKQKHGWDSIYDLQYAALMADPIGEMRKLYDRFDEPFTDAAEQAMRRFLDGNPQGKHGRHAYSLEEYGLSKALVRERFADYCRDFGIPQRD